MLFGRSDVQKRIMRRMHRLGRGVLGWGHVLRCQPGVHQQRLSVIDLRH
jgi:hypothetical protein